MVSATVEVCMAATYGGGLASGCTGMDSQKTCPPRGLLPGCQAGKRRAADGAWHAATQRHKKTPQGRKPGFTAADAVHTKHQVVSCQDPWLTRHSKPTSAGSQHRQEPSFLRICSQPLPALR